MKHFRDLIECLESAPADRPFITFWVDEDEQETVTFGQFRQRSLAHAKLLADSGVATGDRIVIIMPQGISCMAAFVGAMILGAVPAFLAYPNFKVEPSKYRSGLSGVTSNLNAKLVIIDDAFPEEMLGCVSLSDGTRLLKLSDARPSAGDRGTGSVRREPEGLAFIQHSAGTTGLQKGVALTHSAVLKQIDHLANALQVDEARDVIYSWLPLYHDMGLIACFMLPMVCHLPLVMQSPLDWVMHPETMLQIITEHRCTLAWMPNFAFQFVPRRTPHARRQRYDLSSVRALINCSEPVRANSMNEFEQAFSSIGLKSNALQASYAMAENVFAVTQSDTHQPRSATRISADAQQFRTKQLVISAPEGNPGTVVFESSGKLLPENEVRIVNEAGGQLGDGEVGEILTRSDSLFQGYYNRPDLTATALVDGWYHSGDLGFSLRGELYVVGRKKDLLIVGGENVYPQDIEEIAAAHPAIHDGRVVALGIYNPDLGTEDIVVVAEVEPDESLTNSAECESQIRSLIVSGLGLAVRTIFLKPPKWIVKSTAGKAARAGTREKLLAEHPELRLATGGNATV